jgi:acyl-[acyl carrier protein]--UDP-N-acetylglucosamine O-acyltransferase
VLYGHFFIIVAAKNLVNEYDPVQKDIFQYLYENGCNPNVLVNDVNVVVTKFSSYDFAKMAKFLLNFEELDNANKKFKNKKDKTFDEIFKFIIIKDLINMILLYFQKDFDYFI